MIREFLKACPFVDLAIIGQIIFFTVFLSVIFWIFRKGSKQFYQKMAQIPLEQEEV